MAQLQQASDKGIVKYMKYEWFSRSNWNTSGFLDQIEQDDHIMADKGFNIQDPLALCGALFDSPTYNDEEHSVFPSIYSNKTSCS